MLANGKIQFGALPRGPFVGQRIALGIVKNTYVSLHQTEPDDACVTGGRVSGMKAHTEHSHGKNKSEPGKVSESHWITPAGGAASRMAASGAMVHSIWSLAV